MKAFLVAPGAVAEVETPQPDLLHSPKQAHSRKRLLSRPGLIAIKRGMVPYFTEDGRRFPCTVLEVDSVEVTHVKKEPIDGYWAVQLGIGFKKANNVTRQMLGHFARAVVAPKAKLMEFQVRDESGLLPLGTELKADHFKEGQLVDIKSVSKGKGFAGVMKRWNFGGGRATHGTSKAHRQGGSYGQNQTPGRVLPGKKMPGHMGNHQVTIKHSPIIKVFPEKGIILVKGPVSGPDGSFIKLQDSFGKLKAGRI